MVKCLKLKQFYTVLEGKMVKQINEKIREIAQSVNEEGKNEYIYNLYIPKQ